MASHIVINLQEIIAREVSAVKAAVVTIGYFHGGVAYNAIPSEVEIEGTIRALEEPIRQYLAKRVKRLQRVQQQHSEEQQKLRWTGSTSGNQ